MSDTSPRIKTLEQLVGEYYVLPAGHLIDKPYERIRVLTIKKETEREKKHPHEGLRVYITRKALKHYVERRSEDLSKNHTAAEVLTKISLAVEQIPQIIIGFDKYEYETNPEKYFYTKYYPGEPSIRILCTEENASLQICSIHFTQKKKLA